MKKKIGIVGSGSWALALGKLLDSNGHEVTLWSRFEDEVIEFEKTRSRPKYLKDIIFSKSIKMTSNKEELVFEKDIIIMAVPSSVTKEVLHQFKKYITNSQIIINVSKGFDKETKKPLYDVIKSELKDNEVIILSGPSHAEEVAQEKITAVVIAGEDDKVLNDILKVFANDYFRLYKTDDIIGVEIGGALKNIIAICVGLADGLGLGDNAIAALMTRGMSETISLGLKLGANPLTFNGLSGFGDLIVTCNSKHSRNRRCGYMLGQGMKIEEIKKEIGMAIEGLDALKIGKSIAKRENVEVPIIDQLYSFIFEGKKAKEVLKNLLSREQGVELKTTKY